MHSEDTPWWSLPNLLARFAWWLHHQIPRRPILTESPNGFLKRSLEEQEVRFALRRTMTREQLKHEYGFDDDH